jgi:hypothetical protein
MQKALKNKIAIVGVGILAGRYLERSGRALQTEAARLAIEDAGLRPTDVDGAIDVKLAPGAGDIPAYTDAFPRVLGDAVPALPPDRARRHRGVFGDRGGGEIPRDRRRRLRRVGVGNEGLVTQP